MKKRSLKEQKMSKLRKLIREEYNNIMNEKKVPDWVASGIEIEEYGYSINIITKPIAKMLNTIEDRDELINTMGDFFEDQSEYFDKGKFMSIAKK